MRELLIGHWMQRLSSTRGIVDWRRCLLVSKRRPMLVSVYYPVSGVLAMRTIITCALDTLSYMTSLYSSAQSHRPSFQPVRHRSSHFVQSNVFFPNFSLTALCASHIHVPNSLLLLTLGVFLLIHVWKSSAHTQHGYSLPNVVRNDFVSDWSCGVGSMG
jgi:hypothetical protein